jgi:hypothetical protein
MDREKSHNKTRNHEQGMMLVAGHLSRRPAHQFFHQAGRVERGGGFEDHTDAAAMLIERFDIVRQLLVFPPMPLVPWGILEKDSVQLLDMVFAQRHLAPGVENQLGGLGISGHFLLIAGSERSQIQVGKQNVDFSIRQLRAFDSSGGAHRLHRGHMTQRREAVLSQVAERFPRPLELIDFADEP